MPRIETFHNLDRDAGLGLNVHLESSDGDPRGYKRRHAEVLSEMHDLVKVFEQDVPWLDDRADVRRVLQDCFDRFNGGSGREDASYFDRRLRSLSVGDVVFVDGAPYVCESFGWEPVHRFDLRIRTAEEAEVIIRSRFDFGPGEELSVVVPWEA